jgi:hypothetical protein
MESHLFYYYQSGAINESFSDLWGEFIDLTNGAGSDDPSDRWLMGEDIPGGAIRSMSSPSASPYFDPDRIGSGFYTCGESDVGGVHTNSGVNNKAAFLLVDGGSFNGKTVTGLTGGIPQVADLYYEVNTNLLTSGSNYQDLYNALIQASKILGFSAADQQEVLDAVDAVEMDTRPCSDPDPVPVCPSGQYPFHVYFDDLENTGSGNWTQVTLSGAAETWYYPQNSHPFTGFDATYTSSGVYNFWGYDQEGDDIVGNDYAIAMTGDTTLPPNAYMHFNHDWNFDDVGGPTYDGGIVQYSTNGGGAWSDAGPMLTNGYNGTIVTGFGNPLEGSSAFVGESHGMTASKADLSSLSGQSVRFRFRIGTDDYSAVWDYGWFIDDVRIYTCGNQILLPLIIK